MLKLSSFGAKTLCPIEPGPEVPHEVPANVRELVDNEAGHLLASLAVGKADLPRIRYGLPACTLAFVIGLLPLTNPWTGARTM
jgi:hypothetical protein